MTYQKLLQDMHLEHRPFLVYEIEKEWPYNKIADAIVRWPIIHEIFTWDSGELFSQTHYVPLFAKYGLKDFGNMHFVPIPLTKEMNSLDAHIGYAVERYYNCLDTFTNTYLRPLIYKGDNIITPDIARIIEFDTPILSDLRMRDRTAQLVINKGYIPGDTGLKLIKGSNADDFNSVQTGPWKLPGQASQNNLIIFTPGEKRPRHKAMLYDKQIMKKMEGLGDGYGSEAVSMSGYYEDPTPATRIETTEAPGDDETVPSGSPRGSYWEISCTGGLTPYGLELMQERCQDEANEGKSGLPDLGEWSLF